MAYYISFLKTLSLKLNNHTVHFFYNEVRLQGGRRDGVREEKDRLTKHEEPSAQCLHIFMRDTREGRKW